MSNAEHSERVSLEKELALFKDGVQPDQRRIQIYAGECITLRQKLREAQAAFAQAKEEADTLRAELQAQQAQFQTQLQTQQTELARINGDMRQLQGQGDIYRDELRQSKEKADGLLHQLGRYQLAHEQMEAEIGRLTQANAMYAGFGPAGWTSYLIPMWRQYYYENYAEIGLKTELLKAGLDDVSRDTVDLLCKRNFELLPPKKDVDKFLYKYSAFYMPWEESGMAGEGKYKQAFRERFAIPDDPNCLVETTTVEFHNGLKFLPPKITRRIAGTHIIDGGSCWGDSMLAFTGYAPERIHCFEPDDGNYRLLEETVKLNNLADKVSLNKMGLFSEEKRKKLYAIGFSTSSTLNEAVLDEMPATNESSIDLTSIDIYTTQNGGKVGLIKLDVEGVEYDVIEGAKETICRDKPILLISVYHTPRDFFEIKPLIESWGLGYRFMVRKTTYGDLIAEYMLIGYTEEE